MAWRRGARALAASQVRGQHGLLQGGEGAGFDNLGRQSTAQGDGDQQTQGVGESEDDTAEGKGHVQGDVAAPPADAVRPAPQGQRGHDGAPNDGGQDGPGLHRGQATALERPAEQDGPQSVGEGP